MPDGLSQRNREPHTVTVQLEGDRRFSIIGNPMMRTAARWLLIATVTVHGLVHLLGDGPAWWAAALLVLAAAVLLATRAAGWWVAAAIAAVVSQALVVTAWNEAAAGTAANVVLLLAAGYGYLSQGPGSFRAEYRHRVADVLTEPAVAEVVTEADLAALPEPVAAYVRRSGAVGQPRVNSFRARIRGRIRAGADKPWMRFTAEQVNSYGTRPSRLFLMDATMFGVPVDVLHTFDGSDATMRAKVCSLVPVLDASGPDMARAETVTLFNDLCLFAPAGLVDAPVTWETRGDGRVIGTYTNGVHVVTAELLFNDRAELIDFVSDDRMVASADGKQFIPQRWSTPLHAYAERGGRRVAISGEGRWHPVDQPAFPYIELHLDDIAYNLGSPRDVRRLDPDAVRPRP